MAYSTEEWISAYMVMKQEIEEEEAQATNEETTKTDKMEIVNYQNSAMRTCMPTCENPLYMLGLLCEESGELMGKFNKAIRKGKITFQDNQMVFKGTFEEQEDFEAECIKELGDVLWAVAGIAYVFKWDLRGVAQTNLDKLASRASRGVIEGNGDNR